MRCRASRPAGYGPGLTALEQGGRRGRADHRASWTARKDRYRAVFFVKDLLPPMTSTVGVTTPAFAQAHPDKIKAIVAGRRRGVDALYADPAEAARITATAYNLDPAVAAEAIANMAASQTWSPGDFEIANFDRMADGLRLIGEIDGPVDWKTPARRSLPAGRFAQRQIRRIHHRDTEDKEMEGHVQREPVPLLVLCVSVVNSLLLKR
ncbi:MAG: ABC transporter substrate-binding protein [Pseudomonadota bacterium]